MIWQIILAGLKALQEYIALHVFTCLIPAFLLAGAMVTFISRETIIRYLGAAAHKLQSFGLASISSFFVAACSCTVIPVASGIYYGGAGVGPAFILLWVAPAANILALVYTGAILGGEMVAVRIAAAVTMAFVVGTVMVMAFRQEEATRITQFKANPGEKIMSRQDVILILLIVADLLAPNYLIRTGSYLHKVYVWAAGMVMIAAYAYFTKSREDILRWLKETWWFVRIIFPLLLLGVFIVGIIGAILPEKWIQNWLGGSSLLSSFLATMIGAISYFATMTEAPFVDKLMSLGMGKGPALALLLTGPGLSLPNWLAIGRVFGAKKAVIYVITIIILGTLVGWFAGKVVF
ncbi:MAG: permease [candidate division KSB1 bacterium]|nr:permease [candidate division KSB1 bacterium]MDZ7305106.1 permease [candidate division KSB1 bacterium]MDZ7314193.1 permease [candidate division KSB1 bacterium]